MIKVHGIAAHAGHDPRQGVNAINELAMQILDLNKLNDYDAGISVNVGVMRGGTRSNVKAEYAEAAVDVRFVTLSQGEELVQKIRDRTVFVAGAKIEVIGDINRYPLERTEAVVQLYEELKQIAASHGYELGEGMSGGGSDGNLTARLGIPTIDGLGPVGDGAHARNEHIVLDNLPDRAALMAELIVKHLN